MDDKPRNLKEMLSEAKDTSELMIDLGYAAVYFSDIAMAEEVYELETRLSELVHDMRAVCVLAARSPRDADAMASVLQVVGAIERLGNAAVDIGRIVTHRLGIPRALVADLQAAEEIGDAAEQLVWLIETGEELHPILAIALGDAEEVVVRVPVAPGSQADGKSLAALCMETETGFYLLAIRRGGRYVYRPQASVVLRAGDELIATGPDEGHALLADM